MDEYGIACQLGRDEANRLLRDGNNLPKLVRAIREAASDTTGYGAGFLFEIAEQVAGRASGKG